MFTRVTNSFMTNLFIRDLRRNLSSITELQHQISTGKKLDSPSDDPIAADRILDYRQTLDKIAQHVDNINQADSLASNTDGALSQMEDVLLRIRDLAVRGSNEAPEDQQARDAIANEIDALINQMWTQSNQKYDGKFLFSGFKSDTAPFTISNEMEFTTVPGGPSNTINMPSYTTDGVTRTSQALTDTDSVKDILVYDAATDTWSSVLGGVYNASAIVSDPANNQVTVVGAAVNPFDDGTRVRLVFDKNVTVKFNGDIGERSVEIGDGSYIQTSVVGAVSKESPQKSVFGKFSADGLETGSVETFQYLFDLRDSLLKYPNANADTIINQVHTGISDIDKIRENVTNIRSDIGGRVNQMELAKNRLEQLKLDNKELLSNYEDVDMTEALSQLVLQQNLYQAALGVGAQIIQTTLLDFLQ